MQGKGIGELLVGQRAGCSKTISREDILAFAAVTGDFNPVHVDPEAAAGSIFGGVVAHGMLVAGLISTVIGMELPGPGTIYLKQNLKFTRPVRPGDTVTARVEVVALDHAGNRATLATTCANQDGETVIVGEAYVMPPRETAAGEEPPA